MRRNQRVITLVPLLALALLGGAAEDGEQLYKRSCVACHSLGGAKMVGPDLLKVSERQSREWLLRFVLDPKQVIDSGDAYAQAMLKESNGLVMPATPGLTPAQAALVLDYIDAVAQRPPPASTPVVVVTADDLQRGQDLFTGRAALENGGPACITCHAVASVAWIGSGGALGPDLTQASGRFGGVPGLSGWLGSAPTPVMRSLFATKPMTADEARAIAVYLDRAADGGRVAANGANRAGVMHVLGFLVACLALAVIGLVYRHRVRCVRKAMTPVAASQARPTPGIR